MVIATTAKKAATLTLFIITTIAVIYCLRRKQYNEDQQYMQAWDFTGFNRNSVFV